MPRDPESIHSVLFTDIEESTHHWERYAAPMHDALDAHDEILATAISRRGGVMISHTGDGICAVFDTPGAALGAAVDAQLALREVAVGPAGALKVRMGVHHGTVVRSGTRLFGPTMNRSARLMSAAHGGQIVVSADAVALLDGQAVAGLELTDLGWHYLRGVPEPMRVYQACADGLACDFPPLRLTGSSHPHNLPARSSSFIGRLDALTELGEQLSHHRLVTLLGPGGSGKTRLAAEAASSRLNRHEDGVWFVALADVAGPGAVVRAVAQSLGIQEHPGRSRVDTVIARLRDADLLLVLDNCEHVMVDGREFLSALLPEAPAVRVLATSQIRLGLAGEAVFQVEPLSVGDDRAPVFEQGDAGRLFIERARLANSAFDPDDATRRAIARVCARLDGLPLGIELAAAQVRVLSVSEIEARLHDRLRLLGERHAPVARHRTLRAAVDWSYDLLDEPRRRSLDELSVFRGDFGLDAAAAVLAVDELDAIETLSDLADHSLVHVSSSPAGTRYRLLETVRAYAGERLHDAGAAMGPRLRLRAWVSALAGRPHADHLGPEGPRWHDRLDAEYANILLAFDTAVEDGVPMEGLELCRQLWLWFWLRGHLSDGRAACERALESCPDATASDRAPAVLGQGLLAFAQLDLTTASASIDEVLRLEGGGDRLLVGWALLFGAQIAAVRGDADLAGEHLAGGLAIAEDIAPPGHLAGAYYWASSASLMLGDRPRADEYLDTALAAARRVRAPYTLTRFLPVLGKRRLAAGDEQGAIEAFQEALDTSRSTSDRAGVARAAAFLAELHLERAAFDRAEKLLEEAVPIVLREIDDQVFACKVMLALASLHRQRGSFAEARAHVDRALAAGHRLTAWRSSTDPYREQALLDIDLGDYGSAERALALSEQQAQQAGHVERLGRCLLVRAELDALRGRADEAAAVLDTTEIQTVCRELPTLAATLRHVEGRAAAAARQHDAAASAFRSALTARLERGHELRAVESAEGLALSIGHGPDPGAAVAWLGAVAAERSRLSAPRPPVWTAAFDGLVSAARSSHRSSWFEQQFDDGFELGLVRLASLGHPGLISGPESG